jgi:hypothetical protein
MFRMDASDCLRNLKTVERRVADAARIGMQQVVRVAYHAAVGTTLFKDRTGELRGTINIVDKGAYWKRLVAPAKHAAPINYGSKPHVIRAKNFPFLRFVIGGRVIYARKVNHPGTTRRGFMDHAARMGGQAMRIILDEGVAHAVDNP